MKDNVIVILKFIGNNLLIFFIACAAAGFGVYQGIEQNNRNIEEHDIKTAIQYLQSASEEATYQSEVLDNITGDLECLDYKSPPDVMKLEKALYYFDFAGIVLPYPIFSEKILDDHVVRSRLSPTGINSIYRVQEQLKDEKSYILGKETKQQEYMLATGNYPLNLNQEKAALIVDVFVRKEALSLYKMHLNVLSKLLKSEVGYIQGDLTADKIRDIHHEEELKELEDRKKKIELGFKLNETEAKKKPDCSHKGELW